MMLIKKEFEEFKELQEFKEMEPGAGSQELAPEASGNIEHPPCFKIISNPCSVISISNAGKAKPVPVGAGRVTRPILSF
jgi:hypothetical protein